MSFVQRAQHYMNKHKNIDADIFHCSCGVLEFNVCVNGDLFC